MNHSVIPRETLDEVYRRLTEGSAPRAPGDPPQFYFYLVQYRFPRSKKRRIRRKWANDDRNYRLLTPNPDSPAVVDLLRAFGFEDNPSPHDTPLEGSVRG